MLTNSSYISYLTTKN